MKKISACTMDCPDACSLMISEKPDGRVSLRGNPDHPFTAGFICKKIRNHLQRLRSPDRICHPLLRDGDGWRTITWDAALNLCAEKIEQFRQEPESILHIHSDGAKGVLKQAVKLFFARIGATRLRGTLCDGAGYIAYVHDFGSRKNNTATDLLNADRIVNWGKDLSRSSVHMAALVRKARKQGTQVLTISPGGDGNASFSDAHVRIRPGTDRFLAAAVIRRFAAQDLITPRLLSRTRNGHKFRDLILSHSEGQLLAACDVSEADMEKIFRFYEQNSPTATLAGAGVQRYKYGGENVRFINALALISGNMGRSGGGSYFHLHSLGNFNLDWARDTAHKTRRSFTEPIIGREILEADAPRIRMIWVNGSNIINQAADCRQTVRAFESVEFKVVVDAFMTDTAERADLILPSTLMLEQEDIIASFLHDYVQYAPAVFKAPGEARDDFRIISDLAGRLNPPIILPDAETCFRMSLETPHLNISPDELRREKWVRVPHPEIAYEDMTFDHLDGKARFPNVLHEEPEAPEAYPLRLLSLVRREAIHSQMLPEQHCDPPPVWISPDSPALEGLDTQKDLFLVSPLGRLRVCVQMLPGLHPNAVIYRRGDWMKLGGGINQLIQASLTDLDGGAAFYDQYVRLENG